jgi:hypothetical protein
LAGERVLERALPTVEVAAEVAAVDAGFVIAQVGHVPVVIVTYDGDTGARIVPDETRMYL